jgi:hypothetical protein
MRRMKRAGEADELLDAEGEAGDASVAVAFELDELDDALARFAVLDLIATDAGQKQHLGERSPLAPVKSQRADTQAA